MQQTPDPVNQHIGVNIAERRTQQGWSQAELAERIGDALGRKVDPTAVTRIERGTRSLTAAELVAMSGVFNVPMSWLVEDPAPARRMMRRWERIRADAEQEAQRAERHQRLLVIRVQQIRPLLEAWTTLADETGSRAPDRAKVRHALVVVHDLGTFSPDSLDEDSYSPSAVDPALNGNVLRTLLEGFVSREAIDRAWTAALDWDGPQYKQVGDDEFVRSDPAPARVFLGEVLDAWDADVPEA